MKAAAVSLATSRSLRPRRPGIRMPLSRPGSRPRHARTVPADAESSILRRSAAASTLSRRRQVAEACVQPAGGHADLAPASQSSPVSRCYKERMLMCSGTQDVQASHLMPHLVCHNSPRSLMLPPGGTLDHPRGSGILRARCRFA